MSRIRLKIDKSKNRNYKLLVYRSKKAEDINTISKVQKLQPVLIINEAEIDTPEEFIEPILKKLRDQQLIDDHAYAASYVRTMINTDLKGPGVIRQHLRQKGIGENDIDDALTQFTPEVQAELAKKLARKLFRRYRNQPERRRQQKVQQGLMIKGFSSSVYEMIKDEVVPQPDLEQENDLLAKEAAKQWRRVRRYQGYEREQHFKQTMYRKGFDLDDVQSWLDAQDFQ